MAKRKAGEVHDRAFELVSLGRASYASKSAIEKLLADVEKMDYPKLMIEEHNTELGRIYVGNGQGSMDL